MTDEPDFAGAFEAMLEAGSPTTITHLGWSFSFPHSSGHMLAIRSTQRTSQEYSFDQFKQQYRERHGKRFRG